MARVRSANRRRRTVDFLRKRLPAQVGRYLEGVEFPARKEDLLGRLERNGVPGLVLGQLRKRLPEGEYRGPQDVLSALRRGRLPAAGGGCGRLELAGANFLGNPRKGQKPNFEELYTRSSENTPKAKFLEFLFHALR